MVECSKSWLVRLALVWCICWHLGEAHPTGRTLQVTNTTAGRTDPSRQNTHPGGSTSRLDRLEAILRGVQEDIGKLKADYPRHKEKQDVYTLSGEVQGTELHGNRLLQLQALLDIQQGYKDYRPITSLIEHRIPQIHESCQDAYNKGWTSSGIYTIMPDGSTQFHVYCQFGEDFRDFRDFRPSATKYLSKVFRDCSDAHDHGWRQWGLYTVFINNDTETQDVFCDHNLDGDSMPVRITVFASCQDAYQRGYTHSGMYNISIGHEGTRNVYCEQGLDGGGWEVFQQRFDGSVDFFRGWNEYRDGFGQRRPRGEYWLGLEDIYQLTKDKTRKLKVELTDTTGAVHRMDYSSFWLESEYYSYKLHVGGFSGPSSPGDQLAYNNLRMFTTKDHDRDQSGGTNCAAVGQGAWWFKYCPYSDLNARYGSVYFSWYFSTKLSGSRMMIKLK